MAKTKTTRRPASSETEDVTEHARSLATPSDWLSSALEQHDQIRGSLERARLASRGGDRIAAFKRLAVVLTGHSAAEEGVLYPALFAVRGKQAAAQAYAEQSEVKVEMAELERIDPVDQAWIDKLELIQSALLQHMTEEEGSWFIEIKESYDDQPGLSARFREEFERYTRTGFVASNGI